MYEKIIYSLAAFAILLNVPTHADNQSWYSRAASYVAALFTTRKTNSPVKQRDQKTYITTGATIVGTGLLAGVISYKWIKSYKRDKANKEIAKLEKQLKYLKNVTAVVDQDIQATHQFLIDETKSLNINIQYNTPIEEFELMAKLLEADKYILNLPKLINELKREKLTLSSKALEINSRLYNLKKKRSL